MVSSVSIIVLVLVIGKCWVVICWFSIGRI